MKHRWLIVGAFALISISCKRGCADKSAPAAAPDTGVPGKVAEPSHSVYPNKVTPDPLAVRFCDAIQTTPLKRRQACCKAASVNLAGTECVRVLSAAIQSKAVTLDPSEAERCETAVNKELEGCAWVGVWPYAPPAACEGIIHGSLPKDAVCRSALECQKGLRCQGLHSTEPGRCGDPGANGTICGGTTDPLAVYARQDDFESEHPICAGFCDRNRCAAAHAEGDACRANAECGSNGHCAAGRCAKGRNPKAGEACAQSGCEKPARCIQSVCRNPKPEGESCASDDECKGGCVRPEGSATGVCKALCDEVVGLKHVRTAITGTAAQLSK